MHAISLTDVRKLSAGSAAAPPQPKLVRAEDFVEWAVAAHAAAISIRWSE
jgi:hypothetical protein